MVDKSIEDLIRFGAPPEIIEKAKREQKEKNFEVWEENWEAISLFLRLQTQWVIGLNGATGLNYQSVESVFRILGVKDQAARLEEIQVMEAAVLSLKARREKS